MRHDRFTGPRKGVGVRVTSNGRLKLGSEVESVGGDVLERGVPPQMFRSTAVGALRDRGVSGADRGGSRTGAVTSSKRAHL